MAFDMNRNIVDDWLNNILRGVGVRVFDPLAEIDRRLDFDDSDDDEEDEYGGERRRKRRKARHYNRPEWTRCGCGLLIVQHHRATTSTKVVTMCLNLNLNDDFVRVFFFFDFSSEGAQI